MTNTQSGKRPGKIAAYAILGLFVAALTALPVAAHADDDHGRGHGRGHDRGHEWHDHGRGREWHDHEYDAPRYWGQPQYVAAPPVVYAPPQEEPGFNLILPMHFD